MADDARSAVFTLSSRGSGGGGGGGGGGSSIRDDDNSIRDGSFDNDNEDYRERERRDFFWTEEEERTVLEFYGLEDLHPETWSDSKTGYAAVGYVEQEEKPTDLVHSAAFPGLRSEGQEFQDEDSDPLGIVDISRRRNTGSSSSSLRTTSSSLKKSASSLNIKETRSRATYITSTDFEPKVFIREVHSATSFKDLSLGTRRLRNIVEERTETLKMLVKINFDRFVTAKDAIDVAYLELNKRDQEVDGYGTVGVLAALEDGKASAKSVFQPMLDCRLKAENIRATLGVLERFKFFFNLPTSLNSSIRKNEYDVAVRDYKKGKSLVSDARNQKVFEKVWSEVTRVVLGLRQRLFYQLQDPWVPLDVQERIIGYLIDLDAEKDPVEFYLNSQFDFLVGLLKKEYTEFEMQIEAYKKVYANQINSHQVVGSIEARAEERRLGIQKFRTMLGSIYTRDFDRILESDGEAQIWQIRLRLIRKLSSILIRNLPDFHKLSKSCIEGKFGKANLRKKQAENENSGTALSPVNSDSFTNSTLINIVEIFSGYMQKTFGLESKSDGLAVEGSNPIISVHFMTRIISDLMSFFLELRVLRGSGSDFLNVLSRLIERIKSKFVFVACEASLSVSKSFLFYEDWKVDPSNSEVTCLPRLFMKFQKHHLKSLHVIASASVLEEHTNIAPVLLDRIRNSFFDSLYAFSDCLHYLAFAGGSDVEAMFMLTASLATAYRGVYMNAHDADCRALVCSSNVAFTKNSVVIKLAGHMDEMFHTNSSGDVKRYQDVLDQLDSIILEDYIRRKALHVSGIIHHGILYSGIDWFTAPKPKGLRPYVNDVLLSLVLVHAEVQEISSALLNRVLQELTSVVAQQLLKSLRNVERFGLGGMLQASLEVEFIQQILSNFSTPVSVELFQAAQASIDRLASPSPVVIALPSARAPMPVVESFSADMVAGEMKLLREIIENAFYATESEFVCFGTPQGMPKRRKVLQSPAVSSAASSNPATNAGNKDTKPSSTLAVPTAASAVAASSSLSAPALTPAVVSSLKSPISSSISSSSNNQSNVGSAPAQVNPSTLSTSAASDSTVPTSSSSSSQRGGLTARQRAAQAWHQQQQQ